MRSLNWLLALVVLPIFAGAGGPARATAEYDYKADEYVIVDHGLAPDKKLSIAAHGEERAAATIFISG